MSDIFISYEREDAADSSLYLYQHLRARFGEDAVFRDQQKIPSGADWKADLKRQVEGCKVFVLVIGPAWRETRVQKKLADPKNWVRLEIQTALACKKNIFPVLIRDANIPDFDTLPESIRLALESIRPALTDPNHFRFHDGANWQKDLDLLCKDIANKGDLALLGDQRPASPQVRLISRLDRNKEMGCVIQNFKNEGSRLFLATGGSKAGFRYFALRCALDVLNGGPTSIQEFALSWDRFAAPEEAEIRRSVLLGDLMEGLLKDQVSRSDEQRNMQIKDKLKMTRQPTVIYSTVRNFGRSTQKVVDEWFAIWNSLFAEIPMSASVAVILFVEQGTLSWLASKPHCSGVYQCVVNPPLGLVKKGQFMDWADSERANIKDEALSRQITKSGEQLFRFSWSRCHFDEISDALAAIWSKGA